MSKVSNRVTLPSVLLLILGFLLIRYRPVSAQETVTWEVLAYLKYVKTGFATEKGIWCGTGGGVFFYNYSTKEYTKITKADGLSGVQITAIGIDKLGNIWLGCVNGQIDVVSSESFKVIKNITGIRDSRFSDKRINAFSINGDTISIATGYGITLMNIRNFSFIDTYFTLSTATLSKNVGSIIGGERIFASLGSGFVVQKKGVTILNEPTAWQYSSQISGRTVTTVKKLCRFNGQIIAATDIGLAYFNDSVWTDYHSAFTGLKIKDIYPSGDSLIVLTEDQYSFTIKSNGNFNRLYGQIADSLTEIIDARNSLLIGSKSGVVEIAKSGNLSVIVPEGLPDQKIYNMNADFTGNLWIATGMDGAGRGVFRYDNNKWTVYNTSNPKILMDDFVHVFTHPNGDVYAGTWGRGFLRLRNYMPDTMFSAANSPLVGIPKDPSFVVIGGFASDSKQNLWVLNYYPGDKSLFAVYNTVDKWTLIQNPEFTIQEGYVALAIDDNDTKWMVFKKGKSLHYFNENGTLSTYTDDKVGTVTNSGNLSGKTINAIAIDKRNELWVGTDAGVFVLSDTRSVLTSSPGTFNAVYPLRAFNVSSIAVDGINRKWIGTDKGLLVVSSDGNTILAHYKASDSPLLSDEITKLAIDLKNGIVYAASQEGIVAIRTAAVEPQKDFSKVKIFPNPVILEKAANITFEGLVKETEIKILDASGKLVRHIVTPGGGKGFWDALDSQGNKVASGVYFAILFDKEGTVTSVEKIAVIRK